MNNKWMMRAWVLVSGNQMLQDVLSEQTGIFEDEEQAQTQREWYHNEGIESKIIPVIVTIQRRER